MCDHIRDCQDDSDELHCVRSRTPESPGMGYVLQNMHVSCDTVDKWYTDSTNDLVPDCRHQRDESDFIRFLTLNVQTAERDRCDDLEASPCHPGYYSVCYKRYDICIHREDQYGQLWPCRNAGHLRKCRDHQCPTMYKCPQAYCIPFDFVCDGIGHCPDHEDESKCTYVLPRQCPGMFNCKDSQICIHTSHVCDGKIDCPLRGDDENICNYKPCPRECSCIGRAYNCSHSMYLLKSLPELPSYVQVLLYDHGLVSKLIINNCNILKKLDLQVNKIKVIHANTFAACQEMLHLNMSFNLITVLYNNTFQGMANLMQLDITGNPIRVLSKNTFNGLSSLPSLNISSRYLTFLPPCLFDGMDSLQALQIKNTSIQEIQSSSFCHMPILHELTLIQNDITHIFGYPFARLPMLHYLYTDDNHICCTLPSTIKCVVEHYKQTNCPNIIHTEAFLTPMWVIGVAIVILNMLSLVFWLTCESKGNNTWLVCVVGLNLSDLLIGVYILILVISDKYHRDTYTSWSLDTWYAGWACGTAMLVVQISFSMSAWMLALLSGVRVILTVFSMKRIQIKTHYICTASIFLLFICCALAISNVYLTIDNGRTLPQLCLFINPDVNVRTIQWVVCIYNAIPVLVVGILNGRVIVFFIRKKSVGETKGRKKTEYSIIIRLSILLLVNFLLCLTLISMHLCVLLEIEIDSTLIIILQFTAVSLCAIMGPIMNTFSKIKFVHLIRNCCLTISKTNK